MNDFTSRNENVLFTATHAQKKIMSTLQLYKNGTRIFIEETNATAKKKTTENKKNEKGTENAFAIIHR